MVSGPNRVRNVRPEHAPGVFRLATTVPCAKGLVFVQYRDGTVTTTNGNQLMDLLAQEKKLDRTDAALAQNRVMICPKTDILPEDGVFEFRTVENVKDLTLDVSDDTVLMFGSSEESKKLLTVLVAYADLFGMQPVVLTGVPRADYSVQFEDVTFPCPKVSHAEAVDAAKHVAEVSEKVARADKSEKGRSSRREGKYADGGNKFSKFDVAAKFAVRDEDENNEQQ